MTDTFFVKFLCSVTLERIRRKDVFNVVALTVYGSEEAVGLWRFSGFH